jgi:diadenosine tetraphosphate (Ap4A) HIT family hydrolase
MISSNFMAFEIHPRLAAGSFEIGVIGACRLLLKNNALFPWLILVPEVEGIEDLHQLESSNYLEVMLAQKRVCEFVAHYFRPEKLNLGCIGNQVRQMHLHIVGRSSGDPAWPGTVWAFDGKLPYPAAVSAEIILNAQVYLSLK